MPGIAALHPAYGLETLAEHDKSGAMAKQLETLREEQISLEAERGV